VNLPGGILRVERSWDDRAGPVAPKSEKGRRKVPIPRVLGDPERPGYLIEQRIRTVDPERLVFGKGDRAFSPTTVARRAQKAWKAACLAPISFHECRHAYASYLIASGLNAKAISTYLGHASIKVTYDRYGHLMPGNEAEAAGLLNAYLDGFEEG
jgi:integrase